MNTVKQTIAKLIILPLFGGALIAGVAIGTVDSAAATTKVTGWEPPPPAQQGPSGHAVLDGEIAPSTSSAPARPDVVLNGIRVDAEAPAPAPAPVQPMPPAAPAPASKPAAPAQQEGGMSDNKKDGAKSSKGNSARQ